MILMTTIDDSGGLLFNHRRQSQDRILRQHMLDIAGPSGIWMDGYTATLFTGQEAQIHVSETFLDDAGPGAYALLEDRSAAPYAAQIEKLYLYHWNRAYPGDTFFDIDVTKGWQLISTTEFAGSSHDKITEEVYIPCK